MKEIAFTHFPRGHDKSSASIPTETPRWPPRRVNHFVPPVADVGLLTLNQYILLDPILLCFIMSATWGMARVASLHERPFTLSWWFWLWFTGAMLACTIGVKFVGLFVVLLVGLHTVHELWRELGNLSRPIVSKSDTSECPIMHRFFSL